MSLRLDCSISRLTAVLVLHEQNEGQILLTRISRIMARIIQQKIDRKVSLKLKGKRCLKF